MTPQSHEIAETMTIRGGIGRAALGVPRSLHTDCARATKPHAESTNTRSTIILFSWRAVSSLSSSKCRDRGCRRPLVVEAFAIGDLDEDRLADIFTPAGLRAQARHARAAP